MGRIVRRGLSIYFALVLGACFSVPPRPSEFFATAVCTCAVCWDRPFCWSRSRPDEFPAPAADGSCPDGFEAAIQATRLAEFDGSTDFTRDTFFCERLEGAEVDATPFLSPLGYCPNPGTLERSRLAAINPCQDVIFECRNPADSEFATCAELPEDASECPVGFQRGRETSGCSNTDSFAAWDKAIVACSHLGTRTPPSGDRPARYCFTACVDPDTREFDTPENSCDSSLFDPPEVTAGSYDWLLDGTGSTVTIAVGTDLARFDLEGRVAFHAPRCLPGEACAAELSFVRAIVPSSFSLAGQPFDHVVFQNPLPIRGGAVLPVNASESSIEIPAGALLYASADTSLSTSRLGQELTSTAPITGTIRWDTRLVSFDAVFADSVTETVVTLHLIGRLPNRAPLSSAGADRSVECADASGADVTLSGVGSFDPDDPQGAQIPLYFNWTSHPTNGRAPLTARGRTATVHQPVGRTDYDLTVSDPLASSTTDSVTVTVVDTSPPQFDGSQLPLCIPNDNRMRLFDTSSYRAAFQDSCDTALDYRVVAVTSSQFDLGVRTPDVRVATTSFCARGEREPFAPGSRTYSVTVEARDEFGNSRIGTFPVVVPLGPCPGGTWAVPAVADGDPRCGSTLVADAGVSPDAGMGPPGGCQGCSTNRPSRGLGRTLALLAAVILVARRRRGGDRCRSVR